MHHVESSSNRFVIWLHSYEESAFVKAAAIITALGLGSISLIIHFQGINCIAVYTTAGSGAALLLAAGIHTLLNRRKREQVEEPQGGGGVDPIIDRDDVSDITDPPQREQEAQPQVVRGVGPPKGRHDPDNEEYIGGEGQIGGRRVPRAPPLDRDYRMPGIIDVVPAEEFEYAPLTAMDSKVLEEFKAGIQQFKEDKISCFYLPKPVSRKNVIIIAHGWYSQAQLLYFTGKSDNADPSPMQIKTETNNGPFVFAAPFSSRGLWATYDWPILMPDPMPGPRFGKRKQFLSVDCYVQYYKCALYAASADAGEQTRLASLELHNNPSQCERIANSIQLSPELQQSWDALKFRVLRAAVYAKFSQNHLLREMLIATDGCRLIQLEANTWDADEDHIWGPGENGDGGNLYGICLEEVRSALIDGRQIHLPIGGRLYELPRAIPPPEYSDDSDESSSS